MIAWKLVQLENSRLYSRYQLKIDCDWCQPYLHLGTPDERPRSGVWRLHLTDTDYCTVGLGGVLHR